MQGQGVLPGRGSEGYGVLLGRGRANLNVRLQVIYIALNPIRANLHEYSEY